MFTLISAKRLIRVHTPQRKSWHDPCHRPLGQVSRSATPCTEKPPRKEASPFSREPQTGYRPLSIFTFQRRHASRRRAHRARYQTLSPAARGPADAPTACAAHGASHASPAALPARRQSSIRATPAVSQFRSRSAARVARRYPRDRPADPIPGPRPPGHARRAKGPRDPGMRCQARAEAPRGEPSSTLEPEVRSPCARTHAPLILLFFSRASATDGAVPACLRCARARLSCPARCDLRVSSMGAPGTRKRATVLSRMIVRGAIALSTTSTLSVLVPRIVARLPRRLTTRDPARR